MKVRIMFLVSTLCWFVFAEDTGRIMGTVTDLKTGEALIGANIYTLKTPQLGTITNEDGAFLLSGLAEGKVDLKIEYIGYESQLLYDLAVSAEGPSVKLKIALSEKIIPLSEVTVSPGRFSIMGKETVSTQTLTRRNIQTISQVGDDVYRAISRLPGIAGSDFSAKFTVRGGENEEVLVLLDGMELYEPFHVKDVNGGILSIVDVVAIEGIDLLTGGFPAEYGDRTSGVFNITTANPRQDSNRLEVGLSLMNTRLLMDGASENSSWLISARRGYLDIVLDLMGEENAPSPKYYDLLGKFKHRLSDKHTLSLNLLSSYDSMEFVEDDEDESKTGYGNSYGWISLQSVFSPKIFANSLISMGQVTTRREGRAFQGDTNTSGHDFSVDDDRSFNLYGFKQDWRFKLNQKHYFKWGIDLKAFDADYAYFSDKIRWEWDNEFSVWNSYMDTTLVNFDQKGEKISFYLASRSRVLPKLTLELGARYDYTSFTDDNLISPRVNLAWSLAKRTTLRAGWGHFYQTDNMIRLNIQDGEDGFNAAELAEHFVLGLEHFFVNGIHLRIEGYQKSYSDLNPAYRNWLNSIEIFQEMQSDRVRINLDWAEMRGVEFYLKRDMGGKFSWWGSYAYSESREKLVSISDVSADYLFNQEIPGLYNQKHTIYLDFNYRPNKKWHLNLAWQYHSGWPYTEKKLAVDTGDDGTEYAYEYVEKPYGSKYPDFHRMDLRINRIFKTKHGSIRAFFEFINLYDHGNVRTYETWIQSDGAGNFYQVRETLYWFKLMPSFGISWSRDI